MLNIATWNALACKGGPLHRGSYGVNSCTPALRAPSGETFVTSLFPSRIHTELLGPKEAPVAYKRPPCRCDVQVGLAVVLRVSPLDWDLCRGSVRCELETAEKAGRSELVNGPR